MTAGFRGLGERLIHLGYSTPFVNIGSAYMYGSLESVERAGEAAGKRIQDKYCHGNWRHSPLCSLVRGMYREELKRSFDGCLM